MYIAQESLSRHWPWGRNITGQGHAVDNCIFCKHSWVCLLVGLVSLSCHLIYCFTCCICLSELVFPLAISDVHLLVISSSCWVDNGFLFQPSAVDDSTLIRRPMNSFMIFSQEQRSVVRRQHPNLDNRAISKLLGDKWTKLSEDEKRVYYDRASQVRVWYSQLWYSLHIL